MSEPRQYWFPAKRYGWGWGPPSTWEGWLMLVGYVVAIGAIGYWAPPQGAPFLFSVLLVMATLALALVMWLKGEPPRWRWGKD